MTTGEMSQDVAKETLRKQDTPEPAPDAASDILTEQTAGTLPEIEGVTEKRIRTLTYKSMQQYQKEVEKGSKLLNQAWSELSDLIEKIPDLDKNVHTLKAFVRELVEKFSTYKLLTEDYFDFLATVRSGDSLRERDERHQLLKSQDRIIQSKCELVRVLIEDAMEIASIRTRRSNADSTSSSHAARARAKVEAAKVRMEFTHREAQLKLKKATLETECDVLTAQKDFAVAEAEAEALDPAYTNSTREETLSNLSSLPKDNSAKRTTDYVRKLQTGDTMLDPRVPPYVPAAATHVHVAEHSEMSTATELTRLLLKKDLLFSSLTKFNDNPEFYRTWKSSFRLKMRELNVTPSEEIDLLVKWTGNESHKHVLSLKAANANNPERGFRQIWERLDERYGAPEMVEAALKRKLENFPKLSNKDPKRLYELSDIVSEIEAVKEDDDFGSLLTYFDSSSGVTPIVNKLPYNLQEKWTSSATRYIDRNKVMYPPFSHFASFLREQSRIRNNPSFVYNVTQSTVNSHSSQRDAQHVSSRKTSVTPDPTNVPKQSGTLCPIHNTNHSLAQCKQFRAKPIDQRRRILQEKNLCFRCLSPAHRRESCKSNIKCDDCGSYKHTTALHFDYQHKPTVESSVDGGEQSRRKEVNSAPLAHGGEQTNNGDAVSTACAQICGDGFSGKSCAKIVPVKVFHKHGPHDGVKMYALIDDQSNRSLAKPEFFDNFGGTFPEIPYSLSSCAGVIETSGRRAEGFTVQSMDGKTSHNIPLLTECDQIPDIRGEIPTAEVAMNHAHLKNIANSIPEIDSDASILLLIGRDLAEAHHVHDQKTGPRGSPYAQKLSLGWVIVGESCLGKIHRPKSDSVSACKTHVLSNGRASLFPPCPNEFVVHGNLGSDVFERTKDDEKEALSIDDQAFLHMMDREFVKDAQGNWTAPLPFRSDRPVLPNNRTQALKRAHALHAGLQRDSVKREHFVTFMKGVLDKKHAEVAPPLEQDEECWYLPLFGVYHPKKPNKIRGVFDSSATYGGLSLNKVLLKGPDLTNSLLGVLLRFRQEAVAITSDVEQMFYCFTVREDHRNFLRFLWYEDNDITKKLIEYRMCKHVFGNSPSPAVATYGLRRTAQETEAEFGSDMRDFVDRNFYVDDGLASTRTPHEAIDLMTRTREALQTAGIRLHKISSNCQDVIDAFPNEDLAGDLKDLDLGIDLLPTQHSLGLCWDLESDAFTFQISDNVKPFTRRGVLSTINSMYDPLGFLAPVTIRGKVLLRDMVAGTKDWDEPIPEDFRDLWDEWAGDLYGLSALKIPRTYHRFRGTEVVDQELHVYCDASEKAIAAVAYLKTVDSEQNTCVGFVMGKSKVSPKHGHTIPRLELCAALLAVELAELVCDELSLSAETVTYYTDSKVVLGYLTNESRRFFIYVGNRVDKIRRFSEPNQWFHVPTEQNPADHGTRYVPSALLGDSSWLQGPPQLLSGEHVLVSEKTFELVEPDTDKELRNDVVVCKSQLDKHVATTLDMDRTERFSSMTNLVTAIAYLQHIAAGFKLDESDRCHGWHVCSSFKTVASLKAAETIILKAVQHQFYAKEIACLERKSPLPKNSAISSLSAILNDEGLLCVGGRLANADIPVREKNPVLVPGKHHVATLLVRRCHENVRHQGRHLTEGAVRESGYWITGGKRLISSIIHDCVTCQKLRGKVAFQKMSELPPDRLQPGPPFTSVGVDCFGPWQVTTRRTRGGQANSKRWAVLFTCLVSRAVHIEVIEEMSSSSFINALKRFVALRGKVKLFRSDRGTNFVGSTEALGINVERGDVNAFLRNNSAIWIFNPPHSSHMGGVWERMIGVTRRILDSLLLNTAGGTLTHEVLTTFLAEVSAVINSRPLVPLSSDPHNPYPLSPSLILTHKSDCIADVVIPSDVKDMYRAQYKRVQLLADVFWKRWRGEFLQTLQSRRKWKADQRDLQEGDVVLLKDKELARNSWPTGVLTKVLPSADGKIRTAEVRVIADSGKPTVYTRPISEFVMLVPSDTV